MKRKFHVRCEAGEKMEIVSKSYLLLLVAIYGTKFFGSNKKSCPECLRNKTHCFHSGAVMSIVGDGPKLVIDFENYRPGQGTRAIALCEIYNEIPK